MTNNMNQFQNDVANAANGMMTQLLCAEKGIDYNALMAQAQQTQLNNILMAEQQRQMNQLVQRHYGNTGSFVSKVKEVFAPAQMNMLAPMPIMNQNILPAPQQGLQNPMNPQQVSQFLVGQPAPVAPPQYATPVNESERVDGLASEVSELKNMIGQLHTMLTNQNQPV